MKHNAVHLPVEGAANTISRELRRNRRPQGYGSATARVQCTHHRKAGRPAVKLHADALLFGILCHFLRLRWSPQQIALSLAPLRKTLRVLGGLQSPCARASRRA